MCQRRSGRRPCTRTGEWTGRPCGRSNRRRRSSRTLRVVFRHHFMLRFGIIETGCVVGFVGQLCPKRKHLPIDPASHGGIRAARRTDEPHRPPDHRNNAAADAVARDWSGVVGGRRMRLQPAPFTGDRLHRSLLIRAQTDDDDVGAARFRRGRLFVHPRSCGPLQGFRRRLLHRALRLFQKAVRGSRACICRTPIPATLPDAGRPIELGRGQRRTVRSGPGL